MGDMDVDSLPDGAIIAEMPMPIKHKQRDWGLRRYASNKTSIHGEDGILQRLFYLLSKNQPHSHRSRWLVDVGARDGVVGSHSFSLLINPRDDHSRTGTFRQNWSGVLIESDPDQFAMLRQLHTPRNNLCLNASISTAELSADSLTALLKRCASHLPTDFDLLNLDMFNGSDYWVLQSMFRGKEYFPKVICVKYNPFKPNHIVYIPARGDYVQQPASLAAYVELASSRGYELVEATSHSAFFVQGRIYQQSLRQEVPSTDLYVLRDSLIVLREGGRPRPEDEPLSDTEDGVRVLSPSKRRSQSEQFSFFPSTRGISPPCDGPSPIYTPTTKRYAQSPEQRDPAQSPIFVFDDESVSSKAAKEELMQEAANVKRLSEKKKRDPPQVVTRPPPPSPSQSISNLDRILQDSRDREEALFAAFDAKIASGLATSSPARTTTASAQNTTPSRRPSASRLADSPGHTARIQTTGPPRQQYHVRRHSASPRTSHIEGLPVSPYELPSTPSPRLAQARARAAQSTSRLRHAMHNMPTISRIPPTTSTPPSSTRSVPTGRHTPRSSRSRQSPSASSLPSNKYFPSPSFHDESESQSPSLSASQTSSPTPAHSRSDFKLFQTEESRNNPSAPLSQPAIPTVINMDSHLGGAQFRREIPRKGCVTVTTKQSEDFQVDSVLDAFGSFLHDADESTRRTAARTYVPMFGKSHGGVTDMVRRFEYGPSARQGLQRDVTGIWPSSQNWSVYQRKRFVDSVQNCFTGMAKIAYSLLRSMDRDKAPSVEQIQECASLVLTGSKRGSRHISKKELVGEHHVDGYMSIMFFTIDGCAAIEHYHSSTWDQIGISSPSTNGTTFLVSKWQRVEAPGGSFLVAMGQNYSSAAAPKRRLVPTSSTASFVAVEFLIPLLPERKPVAIPASPSNHTSGWTQDNQGTSSAARVAGPSPSLNQDNVFNGVNDSDRSDLIEKIVNIEALRAGSSPLDGTAKQLRFELEEASKGSLSKSPDSKMTKALAFIEKALRAGKITVDEGTGEIIVVDEESKNTTARPTITISEAEVDPATQTLIKESNSGNIQAKQQNFANTNMQGTPADPVLSEPKNRSGLELPNHAELLKGMDRNSQQEKQKPFAGSEEGGTKSEHCESLEHRPSVVDDATNSNAKIHGCDPVGRSDPSPSPNNRKSIRARNDASHEDRSTASIETSHSRTSDAVRSIVTELHRMGVSRIESRNDSPRKSPISPHGDIKREKVADESNKEAVISSPLHAHLLALATGLRNDSPSKITDSSGMLANTSQEEKGSTNLAVQTHDEHIVKEKSKRSALMESFLAPCSPMKQYRPPAFRCYEEPGSPTNPLPVEPGSPENPLQILSGESELHRPKVERLVEEVTPKSPKVTFADPPSATFPVETKSVAKTSRGIDLTIPTLKFTHVTTEEIGCSPLCGGGQLYAIESVCNTPIENFADEIVDVEACRNASKPIPILRQPQRALDVLTSQGIEVTAEECEDDAASIVATDSNCSSHKLAPLPSNFLASRKPSHSQTSRDMEVQGQVSTESSGSDPSRGSSDSGTDEADPRQSFSADSFDP